jgi:branched-chain amino acid transport system permease protein
MSDFSLARLDAGLLIVLGIGAASVPFLLSGYEIKLATTITIQAGLAVALGFAVGPAGLISMGHAAFYGLAAYLFAMVAPKAGPADLLLTGVLAIAGAAAGAALVGALSLRSRGLYFIMMTLAFGQLGFHVFNDTGIGGSSDGSYIYSRPELHLPGLTVSLENARAFYAFVAVVVGAVVVLCWVLKRSAFGSILAAARDNDRRVRAFGFTPYWYRLVAFTISGAMAGAMGYLTAAQNGFVAPQMLAWHASALALVMVLIGGKDTVSGPALGAILLLMAEEILQRLTEHWIFAIGLLIVAVVLVAPSGLVPYSGWFLGRRGSTKSERLTQAKGL